MEGRDELTVIPVEQIEEVPTAAFYRNIPTATSPPTPDRDSEEKENFWIPPCVIAFLPCVGVGIATMYQIGKIAPGTIPILIGKGDSRRHHA